MQLEQRTRGAIIAAAAVILMLASLGYLYMARQSADHDFARVQARARAARVDVVSEIMRGPGGQPSLVEAALHVPGSTFSERFGRAQACVVVTVGRWGYHRDAEFLLNSDGKLQPVSHCQLPKS